MSIHASRVTKTIPIPFDPPHEVTIQKLSGRHLAKASEAFQNALFLGMKDKGGAQAVKEIQDVFRKLNEGDANAKKTIAAVRADPLNGFDKQTLIKGGLKSWTYTDVPVTADAIEDLDADAVDYFATEILRLTKPSLFQTDEEREAAQKNV